jgi:hypothetical protein
VLFLRGTDPHGIATAIAVVLGRPWLVVEGKTPGGVLVGWEQPASVTITGGGDEPSLARGLSAKLGALVVLVDTGLLVVFDKGTRVRGILAGKAADGTPFPFESDVIDDKLTLNTGVVETYCERLGLQIRPGSPITHSVIEPPTAANRVRQR